MDKESMWSGINIITVILLEHSLWCSYRVWWGRGLEDLHSSPLQEMGMLLYLLGPPWSQQSSFLFWARWVTVCCPHPAPWPPSTSSRYADSSPLMKPMACLRQTWCCLDYTLEYNHYPAWSTEVSWAHSPMETSTFDISCSGSPGSCCMIVC